MGRAIEEMKYMQTNTYCLHISRDELEALYFKASCVSVTIEQLLKDIIADLVGGTFTHGSDERMYADQWFRRCYMFPDKTFIRYLIIRDKVDELLEDYEKLKEYQNDYVQMQKLPDVYEPDEVMATQKEIETLSAYIKEIYESYLKSLDDEPPEGSLEEVISKVQVWNDKRLKLLKGEYEI